MNWRQVMDYSSIQVEPNSSMNKIISVHVPFNVSAGDYDIDLEAFEAAQLQSFAKVSIPIRVRPSFEISIEKFNTPKFLLAGDSLTLRFVIQNKSNTDVSIVTKITNGKTTLENYYKIAKDSSLLTHTLVSTPKDLDYNTQLNISMNAYIDGKAETAVNTSYILNVIPSGDQKFDGYNRYPVKITGIMASSNRTGINTYGFMYDIQGRGHIDEAQKKRIDFHFRGPDRRGDPLLGLSDEYYMSYHSPKTDILVGDNNYGLSSLTESSRLGRGVRLQYKFNKLSVGSFYHIPRYYPGIKNTYSVYSSYKLNDKIQFATGYLAKTDTLNQRADLLTLSGDVRLSSWIKTNFELAMGQRLSQTTKAMKGLLNINTSFLNAHLNYIYADPNFPGYITNSLILSTGVSTYLGKKISLSLSYDQNSSNLALDTLYANAPQTQNLSLITLFRLKANNSIGLSAHSIEMIDRAENPLFNYKKHFVRASYNAKLKRFNMSLQGEYGKIQNALTPTGPTTTDFYNENLNLQYAFNETFSIRGFVNYQGGKQYQVTGSNRFYYGGSLQLNLKKTYVSFDYQSDYELKEYYRDRSLLSLQLHQELGSNHELDLSTNYNMAKNSLDRKELSIQLRYSYTLNVPLSKKKNVGSFTGKLINKGVEKVGGIIVSLDGQMTMTDKNGDFRFPMVKTGSYHLLLDETSFGISTITGTPGPYLVEIKSGKETKFEIELTKAANLQGSLLIQEDASTTDKGFYPVKEEIEKLIIEATNGEEMFRIFTASDGTFRFNDLRPGTWNVKVYPNGIPSGYKLEKDQFVLELSSGEVKHLDLIIHKKNRVIKIQSNF